MREFKPIEECATCEYFVIDKSTGIVACRNGGRGLYRISEWEGCVEYTPPIKKVIDKIWEAFEGFNESDPMT